MFYKTMSSKTCTKCESNKPLELFPFKNKRKGTLSSWCKECFSSNYRETKDRPSRVKSTKDSGLRSKLRNSEYLWNYLLEHPCEACGESDPRVLEFDHLDRSTKSFNIQGNGCHTRSLDSLKTEIEKCRVLCANCHRKHTYIQMGFLTFDDRL
jgi:hypothetical protein